MSGWIRWEDGIRKWTGGGGGEEGVGDGVLCWEVCGAEGPGDWWDSALNWEGLEREVHSKRRWCRRGVWGSACLLLVRETGVEGKSGMRNRTLSHCALRLIATPVESFFNANCVQRFHHRSHVACRSHVEKTTFVADNLSNSNSMPMRESRSIFHKARPVLSKDIKSRGAWYRQATNPRKRPSTGLWHKAAGLQQALPRQVHVLSTAERLPDTPALQSFRSAYEHARSS